MIYFSQIIKFIYLTQISSNKEMRSLQKVPYVIYIGRGYIIFIVYSILMNIMHIHFK